MGAADPTAVRSAAKIPGESKNSGTDSQEASPRMIGSRTVAVAPRGWLRIAFVLFLGASVGLPSASAWHVPNCIIMSADPASVLIVGAEQQTIDLGLQL